MTKQVRRGTRKPTKHEVRRARARRQERTVLLASIGVLVLAAAILGFGFYQSKIAVKRKPVAVVNGQAITTQAYQEMVAYQRFELMRRFGSQIDPQTLTSFFQDQLPQQVLEDMIDTALIEQEAARRGIAISEGEVQRAIEERFGYFRDLPTPTPPPENAETVTGTAGSTLMTRTQFEEAFQAYLQALKTQTGLSETAYRDIVRQQLLREKLRESITADLPTVVPQVHARHILVETEEEAQQVRERILNGEDFAAVAKEVSKDPGSAQQGGDLGWFPQGQMVPEFDKVAFSLPVGQLSDPVKTQFGYHIIEVLERDDNRPLSPDQLDQAQRQRFDEWLQEQRASADIQRMWAPEMVPTLAPLSSSGG